MSISDPIEIYLGLSQQLFEKTVSESKIALSLLEVPPLTQDIFDELARRAEAAAGLKPRYGWSIAAVADKAAGAQKCSLYLRSLAAWRLGRAANEWGQPGRVTAAISRARRGFSRLKEPGWLAACDWQFYDLAWAKTDFVEAVSVLENALQVLQETGPQDFVPQCQLALANARVRTGDFEGARENISASEAIFLSRGDLLGQARCWFNEAGRLRRQARFDEAQEVLERALPVFEAENAQVDLAKAQYLFGLIQLFKTDDLDRSAAYFEQAAATFKACDLDLWQASSAMNLGSIYVQTGQFAQADRLYRLSSGIFKRYRVLSLLADNLNDSGKLNTRRGRPRAAVEQFRQAIQLYDQLGARFTSAVYSANLGEAFGQLGRYQDALYYLEKAAEDLRPSKNYLRLGDCERYEAVIWFQLGQYSDSLAHLDTAAEYYERAGQRAWLSSIYNSRAAVLFRQGEVLSAVHCLEKSLEIASSHGARPQAVLARRLLGEALLAQERYADACSQLEQALREASELGMLVERAACMAALGTYYMRTAEFGRARAIFRKALQISAGAFPELDWNAYAGLADLAERQGDLPDAMEAYRYGVDALAKVRLNLWQPALANSYLQVQSTALNKAIALAVKTGDHSNALRFVESNKATTLLRQLLMVNTERPQKKSQELNDLKAEINLLHEQLRVSFDRAAPIPSAIKARQTRGLLIEKARQYDALLARLERKEQPNQPVPLRPDGLSAAFFAEAAGEVLGPSWVALDYYLQDDQLVAIQISPEGMELEVAPVPNRVWLALDECHKLRQSGELPDPDDLEVLGSFLIPASLIGRLTPETFLLLAPHSKLYGIPWGALCPPAAARPLVDICVPSTAPSLRNLLALWRRGPGSQPARTCQAGLLVGSSQFSGRRPDLPLVQEELRHLRQWLGPGGIELSERNASWQSLYGLCRPAGKALSAPEGLARFDWLHIASHVFADTQTGRLSGIALWDGDIWLDQLRDLAPLPDLVTFSACNSIYSYLYEGDEQLGLATTCLVAGAQSVIGSIWPVQDYVSAEFMARFYQEYSQGLRPSQALAQAQRWMVSQGKDALHWAGYVNMGLP